MSQSRRAYYAHHLAGPGAALAAGSHLRYRLRRLAGARREALCGPEAPALPDVLWKVLRRLGVRAVQRPGPRVAVAVHWSLDTWSAAAPAPGAVNAACTDISKSRVDAAMRAVLGYGAAVDPTTHHGECVRKSEVNARHDGVLVRTPVVRPEPGAVYERRIDTRVRPDTIEELRTPVIAGAIPFVYLKRRPVGDPFGHGPSRAWRVPAGEVLTPGEQTAVVAVCRELGLDMGEVDVLRDRGDGRIHVVDANRTPWGPPRALGTREALRAVDELAARFEAAYLTATRWRTGAERTPARLPAR